MITGCTEGEGEGAATHSPEAHRTQKPSIFFAHEDSDSDVDNYEDGDLKPAASNEESDSDYDNVDDGDLKT